MKLRNDRLVSNAVKVRAFVLENLVYDEEEGAVYIRGTTPRFKVPIEPGNDQNKRPRMRIAGQPVLASHVAFILKTQNWPALPVRHLNGDETDIRWSNLALAEAMSEEDAEEAVIRMANDQFLMDLRRYHPNGPPTYAIKSSGQTIVFHKRVVAPNGYGGGAGIMCADH